MLAGPGQERWGRSVLGKGCAEHLRPGPLGSGHPDRHSFTGRTLRPERQPVSPENRSAEQTLRVTQEGLPAPTRLSANPQPSRHRSPLPCSAGPQPPRGARGPDTPAQHGPHRREQGPWVSREAVCPHGAAVCAGAVCDSRGASGLTCSPLGGVAAETGPAANPARLLSPVLRSQALAGAFRP